MINVNHSKLVYMKLKVYLLTLMLDDTHRFSEDFIKMLALRTMAGGEHKDDVNNAFVIC